MNNEETQFLNGQNGIGTNGNGNQAGGSAMPESKKSVGAAAKTAFALGGFAAGVASSAAVNAYAADKQASLTEKGEENDDDDEIILTPENTDETEHGQHVTNSTAGTEGQEVQGHGNGTEGTDGQVLGSTPEGNVQTQGTPPTEHEAIMMTDEGIGVGQVSDDLSFGEAFAQARAQVGPGGVFEWHGNVYNTYLKEEWSAMSAGERAEFQSRVDYQDVADLTQADSHDGNVNDGGNDDGGHDDGGAIPAGGTYTDDTDAEDPEIKILGVESGYTNEGDFINVAVAQVDGHDAIFVDVDGDGTMDVLAVDFNDDGQIDPQTEAADISQGGVTFSELSNAVEGDSDMLTYTSNDISDYDNNADVSFMA